MATMSQTETAFQLELEEAGFEGLTKKDVQDILDALSTTVERGLARKVTKVVKGKNRKVHDFVAVRGLGRFSIADRQARMGRNPQTGEAIKIAASKKLKLTITKPMRDSLGVK